ncbi:hypothetical protein B0I35DRAFT_474949 [Stachybotrys elegans]|uniref:DNA replication factor Cdt1 C-terminal domain-containing protein n=1 Tax=Stachybotrys elegans TaxID=80388 RepID=A0A8K0SW47_9HYPO|nr:hypothetical protein B0I35DRAFT_474949 [Stachybotrys elegans]
MPRLTRRAQGATVASSNQSISNFTRVTKSQVLHDAAAASKKAAVVDNTSLRKRKASSIEDEAEARLTLRNISYAPSSDEESEPIATSVKRACRREEPKIITKPAPTPVKGKRAAKAPPSRAERSHRPIESTILAKSKQQTKTIQTKILDYQKKARKTTQDADALPPHLAEMVDLHKAFLQTMMVQLAQNGDSSPVNITSVAPQISLAWRKRAVKIEDIRRCIAIQSTCSDVESPFMVSDYGHGKVCVELRSGISAATVNEAQLCKQFEKNLRALATEKANNQMTDVDIPLESLSLAELPQADITTMKTGLGMNPLFAKGLRALGELKEDMATKQQQRDAKKQAANDVPMLNPDGSKMSLLDRIRLKQLAKAGEPLPPSGPELQRRAALNRVVDVAATISMLSLSNPLSLPRQAFTMAAILEKLKDSLRVPVSREEGMTCIRLIATEIAPEWIRIVTIGGRENVVIQRHAQPVDRVIQERVQRLLA